MGAVVTMVGISSERAAIPAPRQVAADAFFMRLVQETDQERRAFESDPKILDIVANGLSVERYRALLMELYPVVWHFNTTCAAAASRIGDDHQAIRHFLYRHMSEESGHEEWVLSDLAFVGVERDRARAHRPSLDLLAMNGYNYWSADRRHPCAVLGMMYALEVIASVYGGPISAAITESLLLDGTAGISFISSHVTMDAEHMAELRTILNTIVDPDAQEAVVESANVNFRLFTRILRDV